MTYNLLRLNDESGWRHAPPRGFAKPSLFRLPSLKRPVPLRFNLRVFGADAINLKEVLLFAWVPFA
jgi:hypothetical protein